MKALLSVSNKEGIIEFARRLVELGFELLATPGTAAELISSGITVVNVGKEDEWPPYALFVQQHLQTLTRAIHAALLIDPKYRKNVEAQNGLWIDLLCLDPYPLEEIFRQSEASDALVRDNIDVGGISLLKSAIQGKRIIICDSEDRPNVIRWLQRQKPDEEVTLARMARKALQLIRRRNEAMAVYLERIAPNGGGRIFPDE